MNLHQEEVDISPTESGELSYPPTYLPHTQYITTYQHNQQSPSMALSQRFDISRMRQINYSKRNNSNRMQDIQLVPFADNLVRTAKYTLYTWFPKSLLIQFRKVQNLYFLMLSIVIIATGKQGDELSLLLTFAGTLMFSMLREGFEDYFRYINDRNDNNQQYFKYERNIQNIGYWTLTKSKDLQVGDIVKIQSGDFIPADLILLSCSGDTAYIDTTSLDGENNKKIKTPLESTKVYNSDTSLEQFQHRILCDRPSQSINNWSCWILKDSENLEAFGIEQQLLRGSRLIKTEYVYGIIAYAGTESKIVLNRNIARVKYSRVYTKLHTTIFSLFILQALLCLILAITSHFNEEQMGENQKIIQFDDYNYTPAIFIDFWLHYSHMVPISLYVAMEILKLSQKFLIGRDAQMYDEDQNYRSVVRNSDLIEEIGQVKIILSDKTGTLTKNELTLKYFWMNNHQYGGEDWQQWQTEVINVLEQPDNEDTTQMNSFLTALAVCHEAFCLQTTNSIQQFQPQKVKKEYQTQYTLDLAMLTGALKCGYELQARDRYEMHIRNYYGHDMIYQIMAELKFDYERKRMSIIVSDSHQNYILYCKGADSSIFPLASPLQDKEPFKQQVDVYAKQGYKVLVVAYKQVDHDDFNSWYTEWDQVRHQKGKDQQSKIQKTAEKIENDLQILGVVAIEDKLQVDVPNTINLLKQADIMIWVLTGDHKDTAIEIGRQCNLVSEDSELIYLNFQSNQQMREELKRYQRDLNLLQSSMEEIEANRQAQVIVMEGTSLAYVLNAHDRKYRDIFFRLCNMCQACIFARLIPAQKSRIVKMIKSRCPWVTLAIGDGANDVSMIQSAHVGVGIHGRSGTQAVQASDFSMGKFKFLARLLLVHGRWGYRRVSWFICYYFYKNIALVFAAVWCMSVNEASQAQYFFEKLPTFFNALWTSWPCLFVFALEQDLSDRYIAYFPALYKAGQKNVYFTLNVFWYWVIQAIYHGSVCFLLPCLIFMDSSDKDGKMYSIWHQSTFTFTLLIFVLTFKLFIESRHWTMISLIVGVLSIAFYFVCIMLTSIEPVSMLIGEPEMSGVIFDLLKSMNVWLTLLLLSFFILLPDFLYNIWCYMTRPTPLEKIYYMIQRSEPKYCISKGEVEPNNVQ